MKKEKIILVGDVHGQWSHLNRIINQERPDIVLQAGDFGIWANYHDFKYDYCKDSIKNGDTKIYWCDGNHEDHISIRKVMAEKGKYDIGENIHYMPRSSVLTLPDGRRVLFIGGAWSVDWDMRTDGKDWFREEELISQKDVDPVFDMEEGSIDIVVSHTCPNEFIMGWYDEHQDPSRKALSAVLKHLKPYKWYFGHWHNDRAGQHIFSNNTICKWQCLNMTYMTGCWKELKND